VPVDPALTPRQLRIIADRVEQLTKARVNNAAMGVPTTPDTFGCRFPSGHRGTVQWAEAPLTSASARERNGGKRVFRYVVLLHDLRADADAAGDTETAVPLTDTDGLSDAVQQTIKGSPHIRIE
jgi:hypothetical protein